MRATEVEKNINQHIMNIYIYINCFQTSKCRLRSQIIFICIFSIYFPSHERRICSNSLFITGVGNFWSKTKPATISSVSTKLSWLFASVTVDECQLSDIRHLTADLHVGIHEDGFNAGEFVFLFKKLINNS